MDIIAPPLVLFVIIAAVIGLRDWWAYGSGLKPIYEPDKFGHAKRKPW